MLRVNRPSRSLRLKPSRSDFLLALLRFVVEFILDMALCAKVRLVLPLISLARIGVAPLRKPVGRARVRPVRSAGHKCRGRGLVQICQLVFWALVALLVSFRRQLTHAAEITNAWIRPSIGPLPKRLASASAAARVAASRPGAPRASISPRIGVPWQNAIAGSCAEAA
jgi:hypothetical protein